MKKAVFFTFFLFCLGFVYSQNNNGTSIAMLNYLATETRIINSSKNNRLVLEEIYTKLINNTNPGIVDATTKDYLKTMLDVLESFRVFTLQRERLEYIYENQKAQAITQSLPNPLYLLGVRDLKPLSIIATIAAMTLDSIFKFKNAWNTASMDLLKGNWELDDKESGQLHILRSQMFFYMLDIAKINKLDTPDTLNEISIDNFVKYLLDENLQRRRQSLESNRALYAKYAPYWIALAETYYDLGMYRECINAVNEYEAVFVPILRKDSNLARILPKVIVAISNVYGTNSTYQNLTKAYLEKLVSNTTEADWTLRYFAAQSYISMAGVNNRRDNLTAAYNLLLENVTYLSREQEALLDKYVKPIDESIPGGLTPEKVKERKQVISTLKKERVSELPPLHDGFLVSFQTLLPLMRELNLQSQERGRIKQIVDKSFINPQMRYEYLGEEYNISDMHIREEGLIFKDVFLTLPIGYASDTTQLKSIIIDQNGNSIEPPMSWSGDTLRDNAKQIGDIKAKINLGFKYSFKKNQEYEVKIYIRNKIMDDEYLMTAFHIRKERGGNNFTLIKAEKYVE